jgi:hypothetical protein
MSSPLQTLLPGHQATTRRRAEPADSALLTE